MLARDVMTTPVVTVAPDTPVRAAAELLMGRGFTACTTTRGRRGWPASWTGFHRRGSATS